MSGVNVGGIKLTQTEINDFRLLIARGLEEDIKVIKTRLTNHTIQ
jgi:hypothetical protein